MARTHRVHALLIWSFLFTLVLGFRGVVLPVSSQSESPPPAEVAEVIWDGRQRAIVLTLLLYQLEMISEVEVRAIPSDPSSDQIGYIKRFLPDRRILLPIPDQTAYGNFLIFVDMFDSNGVSLFTYQSTVEIPIESGIQRLARLLQDNALLILMSIVAVLALLRELTRQESFRRASIISWRGDATVIINRVRGQLETRQKEFTDLEAFLSKTLRVTPSNLKPYWYDTLGITNSPQDRNSLREYAQIIRALKAEVGNSNKQGYQEHLLTSLLHYMIEHCRTLVNRSWEVDNLFRQYELNPMDDSLDIETRVQKALDEFIEQLSRIVSALTPYTTILTESEIRLLTDLNVALNTSESLRNSHLAANFQAVIDELAPITDSLQYHISQLPSDVLVINLTDENAHFARNAARETTIQVQNVFKEIIAVIYQHQVEVSRQLVDALGKIVTRRDLADLLQVVERILRAGRGYGTFNDTSIEFLLDICHETQSVATFIPASFDQSIAINSVRLKLRDFEAFLTGENYSFAAQMKTSVRNIILLFEENRTNVVSGNMNPYRAGKVLKPTDQMSVNLFKGRQEQRNGITSHLRQSDSAAFLLHGPRRMGKTSFLQHLPMYLPPEFISIYLDAQAAVADDASFYYMLAHSIWLNLRTSIHTGIAVSENPPIEKFRLAPYGVFRTWMFDTLLPALNPRESAGVRRQLFIAIDEFEHIGNAIQTGTMSNSVLSAFRNMMQHVENVVLLFCGTGDMTELAPDISHYFVSVRSIELTYLDRESAIQLIRYPRGEINTTDQVDMPIYSDDSVESILHLTHCQPFLIQAICEELYETFNRENLSIVEPPHVSAAADEVMSSFGNYFDDIWASAGEAGQSLLKAVISDVPIPTTSSINRLLRNHVIYKREDGHYDIEVPLVKQWMQQNIDY
ncbi:MAG: hypothetical protein IPO91_28920 [Chloroflexi bacterium]|nr:hypothetical protein [Chloroflexota bacterium]